MSKGVAGLHTRSPVVTLQRGLRGIVFLNLINFFFSIDYDKGEGHDVGQEKKNKNEKPF